MTWSGERNATRPVSGLPITPCDRLGPEEDVLVQARPFLVEPGRFLGDPIKSRSVCGISMVDAVYRAGLVLPVHSHRSAYLCWIRSGLYSESYESHKRECLASTLVFHPAGERHAQRMGRADVFSFNLELNHNWVERTGLCREPWEVIGGAAVECARKLYREFRHPDDVSPLAIEGLMLELAAAIRREERYGALPPVERARRLIQARFLESLSLAEIAHHVQLCPSTLAQGFRRRYGCSPSDYLRSLRLAEARRLLLTTTHPLCQIATNCGFADQSHLTRIFKRAYALTPARYRRLA
jgi:AraC family transcriptional regulator